MNNILKVLALVLLLISNAGYAQDYDKGHGVVQDNVYAHKWANIAASRGEEDTAGNRDLIAEKMTAADISKAQELARECVKKNYKGC